MLFIHSRRYPHPRRTPRATLQPCLPRTQSSTRGPRSRRPARTRSWQRSAAKAEDEGKVKGEWAKAEAQGNKEVSKISDGDTREASSSRRQLRPNHRRGGLGNRRLETASTAGRRVTLAKIARTQIGDSNEQKHVNKPSRSWLQTPRGSQCPHALRECRPAEWLEGFHSSRPR